MSQQQVSPLVSIGDLIQVGESDYRYGLGVLTLRVTAVLDLQRLEDGWWLDLRGTQLRADGSELRDRHAQVRVTALRSGRVVPAGGTGGGGNGVG